MEQYYEQNVVNHNIDEKIKKTKVLNIAKTVCIVLALFSLMTSLLFIGNENFVSMIFISIAAAVPFVIASVLIGHINKRHNTEYDYFLDDETLKVYEIYYRERRKLKHTVTLRNIESVGVFDSAGYRKADVAAAKRHFALVNYENEKYIIYILYNAPKGKTMLFIEPDRGFMIALRRVVSAITVFDGSISEFEKTLAKAEAEAIVEK